MATESKHLLQPNAGPVVIGPSFDRHTEASKRKCAAFTLIELLVVIAIISVLVTLMMPSLFMSKNLAAEKVCSANLRHVNKMLAMQALDEADGRYMLEPTEHNPHPALVAMLDRYDEAVLPALYCPQAADLEKVASNPNYIPVGDTDSVIDTPENRLLGNISYIYWSFEANRYCPSATGTENKKHWRNPTYFLPRRITTEGIRFDSEFSASVPAEGDQRDRYKECLRAAPQDTWVLSDFFRRGAPFPHAREHGRGVNVLYMDGHVDLIMGKPRDNYR